MLGAQFIGLAQRQSRSNIHELSRFSRSGALARRFHQHTTLNHYREARDGERKLNHNTNARWKDNNERPSKNISQRQQWRNGDDRYSGNRSQRQQWSSDDGRAFKNRDQRQLNNDNKRSGNQKQGQLKSSGGSHSKKKGDKYPPKPKKKELDFSGHPHLYKLVYETKKFAIVNKTPGLDVQTSRPVSTAKVAHGLFAILIKINPFLKNVHRIDKHVGGGILLSKGKTAAKMFSRNLRFGGNKGYRLIRRYVAKVPIGEFAKTDSVTMFDDKVGIIETKYSGKVSRTRLIRTGVTDGKFQLLVLELETGRKHQIREHVSNELGLPIFNDTLHGSTDVVDVKSKAIGLHSSYIGVTIGLHNQRFLIPVHFVKEIWGSFIDEEGNFSDEIQKTLLNFETIFNESAPSELGPKSMRLTSKSTLL